MKIKVKRLERGTDLTIKKWIYQIETYFNIGQVPHKTLVGLMLIKMILTFG